jgi:hypothetical protein
MPDSVLTSRIPVRLVPQGAPPRATRRLGIHSRPTEDPEGRARPASLNKRMRESLWGS